MFTLKFQGHFQRELRFTFIRLRSVICHPPTKEGRLPGGIPDSSTGNSTIEKLHEFRALKILGNFVGPKSFSVFSKKWSSPFSVCRKTVFFFVRFARSKPHIPLGSPCLSTNCHAWLFCFTAWGFSHK